MIKEVDDVLDQWARWKHIGQNGGWCAEVSWAKLMGNSEVFVQQNRPDYIPVNALDCQQVDRCVAALDAPLYQAVTEKYLYPAATMEQRCYNCRCSLATFHRRIDAAHRLIAQMLHDWVFKGIVPGCCTPATKGLDTVRENRLDSAKLE